MYSVKTMNMQKKMLRASVTFILLHLSLALTDQWTRNLTTRPPGKSFSEAAATAKPGCQTTCGNLRVPYPFGIGPNCSIDHSFNVSCNNSKPIINGNLEIVSISDQQVRIKNKVAAYCYTETGNKIRGDEIEIDISATPYSYSDTNQFTVVGCDDVSRMMGTTDGNMISSGCSPFCPQSTETIEGFCSGIGCSQTPMPKGLKDIIIWSLSLENHTGVHNFNPCGYSFVGEKERFKFHWSNLGDINFDTWIIENVPIVLDWAIGNLSCDEVTKNGDLACGENSYCVDSDTGLGGYRCNCNEGYEGNPYISPWCTDIDECRSNNPCYEHGICTNTPPGGYTCSCVKGYKCDGSKDCSGCVSVNSQFPVIKFSVGLSIGMLSMFIGVTWLYFGIKRTKLTRMREKFFEQNGGFLLNRQTSIESGIKSVKIFSAKELEKATNNYSEDRILGKGGYGIVYKGFLPNQQVVAIKKSRMMDRSQIEQFINEVIILSQVNHRNVVQLIGCCLENEVPLLVYEFISNGTLFHHIHNSSDMSWFSWRDRLRIAAEAAGALAYLHSAASMPIIHRDIKSSNILLDNSYTVKISDFGASRLISLDQDRVTTLVQGTLGYLDPEYLQTNQLTEKSDVYSFGVVLAELMTGKKPLSSIKSEDERNLASYFIMSVRENRLLQILDPRILREESSEQLQGIGEFVKRCLHLKGDERPTMKEVAMELEGLRRLNEHPWIGQEHMEENGALLDEQQYINIGVELNREIYSVTEMDSSMVHLNPR